MSKEYYVVVSDAEDLNADYAAYQDSIKFALHALDASYKQFVGLESFRGVTATSVKAYFTEVHMPLVMCLESLVGQLATDFGKEYVPGLSEVHGRKAKLPEKAMRSAEKTLMSICEGDLHLAQRDLQIALNGIPAGVSFSFPNASSLENAMLETANSAREVREHVADLEESGFAVLNSGDGLFQQMLASLESFLAEAEKVSSVGSYVPGSFSTILVTSGLREVYQLCSADQAANEQVVLASQKSSIENQQIRIREAEQAAAKEKAKCLGFGLALQVGLFIVGAVALVGTAGAATPLMFALGATVQGAALWQTGKGIVSRTEQLTKVMLGDSGADRNDDKIEGLSELKTAGKVVNEGLEAEYGQSRGWDVTYNGEKMGKTFGSVVIDKGFDVVGSSVDSKEGKTAVKVGSEVVGEVYSQATDYFINPQDWKFDGQGAAGTVLKATQAVTDYRAEEYDREIEKYEKQRTRNEAVLESISNRESYTWGTNW